jgi:gibberellin A4 carboxyl methyltransferase
MPTTTGMVGSGFYDRNSNAQLVSIQLVSDWIAGAVAELTLPPESKPITVLDLGSSEGRNATLAMATVVEAVRRRRPNQPIQIFYSDLPSNNFNGLFRNLQEASRAGSPQAEVYSFATGGSFYGQLVPSGTVHFATTFTSLLWLDQLPAVPVPDFVCYRRPHPPRAGLGPVPAEVVAAFSQQAERDLVHFLEARARELAPGGKLLIVSPGDAPDQCICDGLYDVLNDACLDLVAAGRVARARYEGLTVPIYFRTLTELRAPFDDVESPVHDLFGIDRAETLEVPTPFIAAYQQGGDVTAFAEDYTGFLRAFSEPVVQAALAAGEPERGIIDELYERVRARLLAEPERYLFRYFLPCILLTRR